jgi:anthranilate 1,2-dioxygenase small subunit
MVLPPPLTETERRFLTDVAQRVVDCAGAVDDDRLEDWPEHFTEDCVYRIQTREAQSKGWPIGLIHCEGRAMLRDRVLAIRHGNVFDPHTYRHVVSAPRFAPGEAGTGPKLASRHVLSSFNVTRVMRTGESTLFAVGTYDDTFEAVDGQWLIRERLVLLDSRNLDTLLVIPI